MIRLVVGVMAGLLLVMPAVASADITVTTGVDHTDDGDCAQPPAPGDCTLREALAHSQPGELVVLPGRDYLLRSELSASHNLTVRGAGARTTIIRHDREFIDRVLDVMTGVTLNLSGVTVTAGNDDENEGGGIAVEGAATLNLTDSAVVDNIGDAGGGIWSAGELNIVRSLIAGNAARGQASEDAFGGGLLLIGGSATIENSTISDNSALTDVDGPGVGQGGGIHTSVNLELHNVTIAENEAGTGAFGDGGGLFQDFGGSQQTVATNTLIARNDGGNCAGTVGHPIESTNGLSDNSTEGNCLVIDPSINQLADPLLAGLTNNGGPTNTHALLTGSPGIDKGDTASCPAVDQRGTTRPRGTACDVGAYEFVPPAQGGPPPPPPDEGLPDPVPHKNVNALPKSGKVKIKLPGSDKFVELEEGQQIPLGTIVDTRKGRVTIVAASGDGQTADFYAGIFKLSQTKGSKPITVLTLVEKLTGCKSKKKANAAAKKKRKRRLWGDGRGRFRTKGKNSAATVLGTKWLVEDRCASTLTRVVRGKVRVRDFVKKKTVTVKAGKKYVARARP
jgi:CSLREA domain-containing protein